jgi:hypothetical protein
MCADTCLSQSLSRYRLSLSQVLSEAPSLSRGGPPESIEVCSKSRWMNEDSFVTWLKIFVCDVQFSMQNPSLLIMYSQ